MLRKILIFNALIFGIASYAFPQTDVPLYQYKSGEFLTNWLAAGTFPNKPGKVDNGTNLVRKGFYHDYLAGLGGENKAVAKSGAKVPGSEGIVFKELITTTPEIDLDSFYNMVDQSVAYTLAFIELKSQTQLFLHVGSDDGIRVWIDDKMVIDRYVERGCSPDEDWAFLNLSKGKHRILVKIEDNFGAWKFSLRFVNRKHHDEILAGLINDKLDVKIVTPTSEWQQVGISLSLNPSITDIVTKIKGAWISDDNSETQAFSTLPGVMVSVPEKFSTKPFCSFEAVAEGIPDKKPEAKLNIYFTSFVSLYDQRAIKIKNLLTELSSTSTTYRLALKHKGLLNYYLSELATVTNTSKSRLSVKTYELLTSIDNAIKMLSKKQDYLSSLRGSYDAAYISSIDKTYQPFSVRVPKNYKNRVQMPMVVFLHDADETFSQFSRDVKDIIPYFSLNVRARGEQTGYIGLAERDVIDAIDFMTNYYSVDPNRIYCIGNAMGGYGVWRISAAYPGYFAAVTPMAAFSANLPLENMCNIPTYIIHGKADMVTPVEFSIAAKDFMEKRACPVLLDMLNNVGYQLKFATQAIDPIKWMLGIRKTQLPNYVVINNSYSDFNQAYWLKINSRLNPRISAKAVARVVNANQLTLYLSNVQRAVLDLNDKLVDTNSLLSIMLNGKYFELPAPLPEKAFIVKAGNSYTLSEKPAKISVTSPYRSGSWQKFFNGEPLLIVVGTKGDENTKNRIYQFARKISAWSFVARKMEYGRLPIKDDTQISEEDIQKYNLILIGTPDQNSIVNDISKKIKIHFNKTELNIHDKSFPLKKYGLWLCQPNPGNPKRLIWNLASDNAEFYNVNSKWLQYWKFPAEDPPDVLVMNVDSQTYAKAVHFTKNWELEKKDITPIKVNSVSNSSQIISLAAQTIINASKADFAWIDKKDFPQFDNISLLAPSELATIIFRNSMLCTGQISGNAVKKLMTDNPGYIYPATEKLGTAAGIDGNKKYKITMLPVHLPGLVKAIKEPIITPKYLQSHLRQLMQHEIIK